MCLGQARLIGHLALRSSPSTPRRSSSLKQQRVLNKSSTVTPATDSDGPPCHWPSTDTDKWLPAKRVHIIPPLHSLESPIPPPPSTHVVKLWSWCVCVFPALRDRDRWSGSHHIYHRKQFIEYCQGRAGGFWNSAFKSQPSISPEPV